MTKMSQKLIDELIKYFSQLPCGVPTCISTGEVDCHFRNMIHNSGGDTREKHLRNHCIWKMAVNAGVTDSDLVEYGVVGALQWLNGKRKRKGRLK